MIQKGKTMIQNSRLEDKESLLNRDFIEKRKEDFLLVFFNVSLYIKLYNDTIFLTTVIYKKL